MIQYFADPKDYSMVVIWLLAALILAIYLMATPRMSRIVAAMPPVFGSRAYWIVLAFLVTLFLNIIVLPLQLFIALRSYRKDNHEQARSH